MAGFRFGFSLSSFFLLLSNNNTIPIRISYSLWSLKLATLTLRHVIFLQRISKPEKNHTGPFSTLKGYFRRI